MTDVNKPTCIGGKLKQDIYVDDDSGTAQVSVWEATVNYGVYRTKLPVVELYGAGVPRDKISDYG